MQNAHHSITVIKSRVKFIVTGLLLYCLAMAIVTTILRHVPSNDLFISHLQKITFVKSFFKISFSFICFGALALFFSILGWKFKKKK